MEKRIIQVCRRIAFAFIFTLKDSKKGVSWKNPRS
jgi:hypothetical protein